MKSNASALIAAKYRFRYFKLVSCKTLHAPSLLHVVGYDNYSFLYFEMRRGVQYTELNSGQLPNGGSQSASYGCRLNDNGKKS